MVGFAPRLLLQDRTYDWIAAFRPPYLKNTLFATKGAFLHRDDYSLLWRPEYKPLVEAVDAHITAEDISLSVIFAAAYGFPPVHVAAHRMQVTELCCTASTTDSDGAVSVRSASPAARRADPVCRVSERGTLHSRTSEYREAIQRHAVRLAGGAIFELNTTAVPTNHPWATTKGRLSPEEEEAKRAEVMRRNATPRRSMGQDGGAAPE